MDDRVVLCTKSFPPIIGGSSSILYELVRHWEKDFLTVVHGVNEVRDDSDLQLPFKRIQIKPFNSHFLALRMQRRFPRLLVNHIKQIVVKTAKTVEATKLYLHYPNAAFVVGGYLAAKELQLPYVLYLDILWEENGSVSELQTAKEFEQEIVRNADECFAITEFAVEHLSNKHGRKFALIPHTLDESQIILTSNGRTTSEKYKIHLSGGLNPRMNTDAVMRIYEGIKRLKIPYEFEICSPQSDEVFRDDPNVMHRYYSKHALVETQSKSDLLLLPQAFNSSNQVMIKNNFPTKTMEYVCSGTPIIVHSPEDSYLTWLARKYDFAEVVTSTDINQIIPAIHRVLFDDVRKSQIVNNARKFAKTRSSLKWSKQLKGALVG